MKKLNEREILERQLLEAKKDLFKVGNIRELKAIQSRIHFLTERLKEFSNRKRI